jgi:hypothetical protein
MVNYLAMPIGSSDGNTYLLTWDSYFTDSYVGIGKWDTGQKTFQVTNAKNSKMFEPKVKFAASGEPGFNAATDVGIVTGRSYAAVNTGQKTWAETDGNTMGPGWTLGSGGAELEPRAGTFVVKPNRWTRWWIRWQQKANDWDYFDMWVADENTDPVLVYSQVSLSVNGGSTTHSVAQFWIAHGNSNEDYLRGGLFDLVAYHRNVVVLRNPSNVPGLLVRPLAGPPAPPPPVPAAPTGLRIAS